MSEEFSTLLKGLATATSSKDAVWDQFVDVTVRRPEALHELEQEVEIARRAGDLPEATAVRIVTQMRAVTAATRMPQPAQVAPAAATAVLPAGVAQALARAGVPLGPGSVLKDRFVLKREIGRGGMGAVFAAEDRLKIELGDPEPMVAVKVLQPALAAHGEALVALQREASKAQALAHPNVVTVYDFDRDIDVVFLTMELLNGTPLDAVIRETNGFGLARAKAMSIITGIAQGLAYAHAKGVVHADLKPSNIFLTAEGVPKILDFGIARAVPGSALGKKDTFDAGKLGAYTEAFATAEMMAGGDPSTADDVYALGLIAYELLTARHPYQRLSAPAAQQRALQPKPIKGLSRREWSVIRRSIAFTRAGRPPDAGAFLRQIAGISRLQKGLIAATAVLVVVAGYFGYARYQADGPAPFDPDHPEIKTEFLKNMEEGATAWDFYANKGEDNAWPDALQRYAAAYRLHPRDRDASRALRALAKRVLADYPEQRDEHVAMMVEQSPDYLATYGPVADIARRSNPGGAAAP